MRTEYNCRGVVDFINVEAKNNPRIYVCASGAGAGIQNHLWEMPGCSKYFVGASFPYTTEEMDNFLGFKPEKYCSRQSAMEIAFESFYRAVDVTDVIGKNFNIGVGLTGVVASTREHRGGNRVFCSVVTKTEVHVFSVELKMATGFHARRNDGDISNFLAFYGIGKVLGMQFHDADLDIVKEFEFQHEIVSNDEAVQLLMKYPYWDVYNKRMQKMDCDWAIFPGAFNPVHSAHKEIAKEVEEKTRCSGGVLYTISVDNPHKPSLLVGDILLRAKMLQGHDRLFTLGEPMYIDKVKNWPTKNFIIGSDALERLFDPKWGVPARDVLEAFRESSVRFFVSSRIMNGKEISLENIFEHYPIMNEYWYMFNKLETQIDLSSSEIRNGTKTV